MKTETSHTITHYIDYILVLLACIMARSKCTTFLSVFFGIGLLGAFILSLFGISSNQFYYQKGHALSGQVSTCAKYQFELFKYSYQTHAYTNSTSMTYNEAYSNYCGEYVISKPEFCSNLKHVSGYNYTSFLIGTVFGGIFLSSGLLLLGGIWGCYCNSKGDNKKAKCCQCASKYQRQCDLTFYFIAVLFSISASVAYGLFLFTFNGNFDKLKPDLAELMLAVMPSASNVDWNDVVLGKSNYLIGSGFVCSLFSVCIAFASLIRLCLGLGDGISDLYLTGGTTGNNNNNNERTAMLTVNEAPTQVL